VRTFGPSGDRRRNYKLEAVLRLEQLKLVLVQRRRGDVICAHFYGESRIPLESRFKAGTRYSHNESVGDHRAWSHDRLPVLPLGPGLTASEAAVQLDVQRRSVFLQTVLSVQTTAESFSSFGAVQIAASGKPF
jgi:hypothetical protein